MVLRGDVVGVGREPWETERQYTGSERGGRFGECTYKWAVSVVQRVGAGASRCI